MFIKYHQNLFAQISSGQRLCPLSQQQCSIPAEVYQVFCINFFAKKTMKTIKISHEIRECDNNVTTIVFNNRGKEEIYDQTAIF